MCTPSGVTTYLVRGFRGCASVAGSCRSSAVRSQRVGLPAAAVQREHPRRPEPLAERVRRRERLQFGDQAVEITATAAVEERLSPRLHHGQLQLAEARRFLTSGRRVDAGRRGRTAPQA